MLQANAHHVNAQGLKIANFFLVHKAVIHPTDLEKVCKSLAQGSYRSISDIRFAKLAEVKIRLVGCYGNRELIFKLLLQNNVIDKHRLVPLKYLLLFVTLFLCTI